MDNRGEDRKEFAGRRPFRRKDAERGDGRRQEHENFRPRRFDRDDDRREGRRDFKKDGFRPRGDRGPARNRELGALMDIDNDILHLVIRRAQMLSRLRSGGVSLLKLRKLCAQHGKARPPALPGITVFPVTCLFCSRPLSL